ncbi:hypothetical protein HBI62_086390 [Parastagonospora nodorum]|nr:hypothetical protein HBI62_086390 [Parastagonospora nodorum]KAH6157024.1 hypothetical protein HBI63_081620 [Parastagonospora nodorum]KAH6181303.1 hypothetical protein HBI61_094830 [Parastagonospora nodorum]
MASQAAAPATLPTLPNDDASLKFIIPENSALSKCEGPDIQAPSTCYNMNDMAKIFVFEDILNEDTGTIYELPRGLLRWHSSYFAAALDPDSDIGSKDGELTLNEDHAVFGAFLCWIWTGRLKDIPESLEDASAPDFYLSSMLLCKIWVFGDMRGVPGLCNAAIDMLHERTSAKWKSGVFHVPWAYAKTASGASLRRFMVDTCTFLKGSSFWQRLGDESKAIPVQFVLDALPALISRGQTAEPIKRAAWTVLDRCQWHDHSGPGGKLRMESRE